MKYFRCKKCDSGVTYNATQAFLDHGSRCPRCGMTLTSYRPARVKPVTGATCAAEGPAGERYCNQPTREGRFCARHAYMAHS